MLLLTSCCKSLLNSHAAHPRAGRCSGLSRIVSACAVKAFEITCDKDVEMEGFCYLNHKVGPKYFFLQQLFAVETSPFISSLSTSTSEVKQRYVHMCSVCPIRWLGVFFLVLYLVFILQKAITMFTRWQSFHATEGWLIEGKGWYLGTKNKAVTCKIIYKVRLLFFFLLIKFSTSELQMSAFKHCQVLLVCV